MFVQRNEWHAMPMSLSEHAEGWELQKKKNNIKDSERDGKKIDTYRDALWGILKCVYETARANVCVLCMHVSVIRKKYIVLRYAW